ncbi:hypothetical protein DFQ30_008478 [Apophysomyces sp. BC1015]|nr:hypothetical protein DFQ30_008478 [Apophysomyces sp. BC1015]
MTPSHCAPPVTSITPPCIPALPVARPRVVLDTNVWIDILVFDDPATRPIASALKDRGLDTVQDERCANELRRVLDYPQFVRYSIDKNAALDRVNQLSTRVTPTMSAKREPAARAGTGVSANAADASANASATVAAVPQPLPLCRDRDDQKFLELALTANAQWLVTKDQALLKMARRIVRDFGFRILAPAPFVAAMGLAPPAPGDNATHDATLVLTLSNPGARNALHSDMYAAGIEAVDSAERDPGIHAVVVTGADDSFCAGGNLSRLLENRTKDPSVQVDSINLLAAWVSAIRAVRKLVPAPRLAELGVRLAFETGLARFARAGRLELSANG